MDARGRMASGWVALGMVLVLVLAQLLFVGAIGMGRRDQDLMVRRLETTRAFYAAEAGVNMATREIMTGRDEDGDGRIGRISWDGNPANDPVLPGGARVAVGQALVGALTSVESRGRAGEARRVAEARFEGVIGGTTQTVMVASGHAGSPNPRYSIWTGSGWSSSQLMPSVGDPKIKWVRMKICPTRDETAFVSEDESDDVNIIFFNGSTWGPVYEVSTDTGGTNDRPEDVAYEQLSSDALSVYWKGTVSRFGYRTYNGTTFGAESLLSSPFTTENDYLTLSARPASDEIMLLAADGIAGGPLMSAYWNGNSFGPWMTVVPSLQSNNEECYSMAWEAQTRRGLAVYIESGVTTPRYRTWNGSAWSAQASLPSIGAVGLWTRLAADPTSNTIIFACLDNQNDINVNVWNGTAWGANQELETNCAASDRRQFDVIFERGTGCAIIVYAEAGSTSPRYRRWNGAWSAEASLPSLGSSPEIVHLARGFTNGEVFAAISDGGRKLHALRWDGSSWSAPTVVNTQLSGQVKQQSFSLPEPTPAAHPRLRSWAEAAP